MARQHDIRRARMQENLHNTPISSPDTVNWVGSVMIQSDTGTAHMSEFVASVILSQIMTQSDDAALQLAVERSEQTTASVQRTLSRSTAQGVIASRRWSRGYAKKDDPDACPICMETFKYPKRVARLQCGHLYCSTCIRKWVTQYSDRCPVCRDYVGVTRASPPSGEEAPSARPADAGLHVEV